MDVPANLHLEGDEDRLVQVISNLLTNAGKYTPAHGKISIAALLEGAQVVLQVLDNGSGIQEELLPHIFETFVQGSRGLDRSEGGLGLVTSSDVRCASGWGDRLLCMRSLVTPKRRIDK